MAFDHALNRSFIAEIALFIELGKVGHIDINKNDQNGLTMKVYEIIFFREWVLYLLAVGPHEFWTTLYIGVHSWKLKDKEGLAFKIFNLFFMSPFSIFTGLESSSKTNHYIFIASIAKYLTAIDKKKQY